VPLRIEDYALIGDCLTAALVGRDGSIDWLCLPRFDSGACFAALLGTPEHGRWLIAPRCPLKNVRRAYRDGTLVLDTTFETADGAVTVTDCMAIRDGKSPPLPVRRPLADEAPRLIRRVRGVRGRVPMQLELVVRFDHGSIVPWVRRVVPPSADVEAEGGVHGIRAIAGPHAVRIHSNVPLRGENMRTVACFDVSAGEEFSFVLTWHPSFFDEPEPIDAAAVVAETERAWRDWVSSCTYKGEWGALVRRSLITLKALTHATTGGIVAAPTTSLPEALGGGRNWDYRYSWVRDATFTLLALLQNGFRDEAQAWREWLLRAVAGDPGKLQIMYAVDGARRIEEYEVPWLPGYEGASPVRVGNAAFRQRQLDVYGEVMDALYQCSRHGLERSSDAWDLRCNLLEFLESCWDCPDAGIWEVRGPERQFTHSKVMAWVAFDRAVRRVEAVGHGGPLDRWRSIRDHIHDEVCRRGFDTELGAFVQYFGAKELDSSLLMIPLVGFLPATDPRVESTVRAIEQNLVCEGLVLRYLPQQKVDGLPGAEGAFLPCSFWLADNWNLMGREADARGLFERLAGLCNDVGLLSEEYDPTRGRMTGNFPQAFSHVSLVNSAVNIARPTSHVRDLPNTRRAPPTDRP
jgi:GH15 family glucan-1,4-alpha-glucosidase